MFKNFIKKISPVFLISAYHFMWAFFSALVFGFPSRKIKVIGVTGTNGKTTTTNLISIILEEANYKVAMASSIKFKIGEQERENKLKMTMPGRGVLQGFLRRAVKAGCEYAVVEATSEGVLQHRHRFINWRVMVFTNLSPEHIERHGGFENYKKAKAEYFKICRETHIINKDDEQAEYFLNFKAEQKWAYQLTPKNENSKTAIQNLKIIEAEKVEEKDNKLFFSINNFYFALPLLGKFNVYNALAAISCALSQKIGLEVCQRALSKAKGVPGRMEEIIKEPFRVIVDYAFTPNALKQVYSTFSGPALRSFNQEGAAYSGAQSASQTPNKLICVLGACGGGRDKWKRPILGKIASQYCQKIIVTNEDPYDEDPMEIIRQVAWGAEKLKIPVEKILNRKEAIKRALSLAQKKDIVVITGKGAEPWLCVANNKKIPWDDRQIVREALKEGLFQS